MSKKPYFYTYYKQFGNKIMFRYKNETSETKTKVIDFYQPTLYTSAKPGEESGWKSVYGQNLYPIKFEDINGAKDFAKSYKDVDNFSLEGNSDYANQFIIELFDGVQPDYDENLINIGYLDIEVDADEFPKPADHKYPINAVTFYSSLNDKFYVFALTNDSGDKWKNEDSTDVVKGLDIDYKQFDREEDLLRELCIHWNQQSYDLTTGWNSEQFDMPYLVLRCYKLLGKPFTNKMLSPFGIINIREIVSDFGNTELKVDIMGVPHLDYMITYKKHTYTPRERYKLDYIAEAELGENKLSYAESNNLYTLYRDNFQKFVDYNIQDTNLVKRINQKTGLLSLVFAMAYYALSNYEATLGTVKIWEQLVAKFLFNKNLVPPFSRKKQESREFEGAFVKAIVPGRYKWVFAEDLNSLYPHIIMQNNIGPETHVPYSELPEKAQALRDTYAYCAVTKGVQDLLAKKVDLSWLEEEDLVMAANFEFYRKDKMSFFSEIMRELYDQRKVFKKKMLKAQQEQVNVDKGTPEYFELESQEARFNNMQMGLKILLNGGYGAFGNTSFLYYMVENAEAITVSGQLVNKWTATQTESFLQKLFNTNDNLWIAGDTDSMYLTIDHFMKTVNEPDIQKKVDIADRFIEEVVSPKIKSLCQELCDYMNGYEQKMVWEREVIAENAIWVAKKNYAMQVWDSEGVRYKEPKIKITGLASVKSSTPEWSKEYLKKCYKLALEEKKDEMHNLVEGVANEFWSMDLNDIAIPKGVNGIIKYEGPNRTIMPKAQPHVVGAIAHNWLVDDKEAKRVAKLTDGAKIKYLILNMPNPAGKEYISFDSYLPSEFGLEDYVNKEAVYEKSFLAHLKIFLNAIKWSHEEELTLDSWF